MQETYEYVYFYIDIIFGLHGLYMVALFVLSWILSGSFLAGLLATSFYIFNRWVQKKSYFFHSLSISWYLACVFLLFRFDTTRISFTMPLRESFGFPFLFSQIAFVTYYLKKDISKTAQVKVQLREWKVWPIFIIIVLDD